MALSNAAKSGVAIFVGAVQFGVLLIISEIVYSANGTNSFGYVNGYAYSVSTNYVSDLGANCPSNGACYIPPSALLFDSSIALLGLFILLSAYFLHRAFKWMPATVLIALAGVGALGVGLAPETTGIWHSIFSLMVFLFAGLSAIVTYRLQKKPMSYFSVLLGVTTLIALILYVPSIYLGLGPGGMERMIVYPTLLWAVGFGGHLMALEDTARM
ncbi:MAG: DUF998 domain-containing protein [Nitrososphaerales archaeon]|jgi:hypothetical membrane protein